MSLFVGSGVALVTPFESNGINLDTLDELIEWHIAQGTDALIVSGTTGEASTLSFEERKQLYSHTVKKVNHRIPVIAGTGSNSTEEAIRLSRMAEDCGVNGLIVVTPYYNQCTQDGLYAHYEAIAHAVSLPVILYNVPSRTAVNLHPETVMRLSTLDNIIGIKEASMDPSQWVDLCRRVGDDFTIYAGNDDMILAMLAIGAKGAITTTGNIVPKLIHDLVSNYLSENLDAARAIQFKIIPLVRAVFSEINPIPIKAALNLMGYSVGAVRLPLTPAKPSTLARLTHEMNVLELLKQND